MPDEVTRYFDLELYDKRSHCPSCGSKDIVPMGKCLLCGADIDSERDYCEICETSVSAVMCSAVVQLTDLGMDEGNILAAIADWVENQ